MDYVPYYAVQVGTQIDRFEDKSTTTEENIDL